MACHVRSNTPESDATASASPSTTSGWTTSCVSAPMPMLEPSKYVTSAVPGPAQSVSPVDRMSPTCAGVKPIYEAQGNNRLPVKFVTVVAGPGPRPCGPSDAHEPNPHGCRLRAAIASAASQRECVQATSDG